MSDLCPPLHVFLCACKRKWRWEAVIVLRSIDTESISVNFFPESPCLLCRMCNYTEPPSPAWPHTLLVSGRLFITRRCVSMWWNNMCICMHGCVLACTNVLSNSHPSVLDFPCEYACVSPLFSCVSRKCKLMSKETQIYL